MGLPLLIAAVAALAIGLVLVVVALSAGRSAPDAATLVTAQLQMYGVTAEHPGPPESSIAAQARSMAQQVLASNASLEARIQRRLEGAAVALKPAEWVVLHVSIVLSASLLGLLASGENPLALVLFGVLGAVLPWVYLGIKHARRLKAFQALLPSTLQLMAGSLSAGLSLAQSIDTIVEEGSEPVSSEFRRVIVETRLGVSLGDALESVAERMESPDWAWVVMAIRIQREVGGNLSELLLGVAETLREREYIRRHVKALSAEGRLSAYVLGGLPPLFLLYLCLTKWSYVGVLFKTPIGWVMLGASAVMLAVGSFWMAKVAKVEL